MARRAANPLVDPTAFTRSVFVGALVVGTLIGIPTPEALATADHGPTTACEITGTPDDDILSGTSGDDVICGLGGSDALVGGDGDDILRGGAGDDTLDGGLGTDVCRQNLGAGTKTSCERPWPLEYCPVPGGIIADNFGDPRPGGRTHEGSDIFATKGTPIYAPFDGTTVNAQDELGGRTVTVYGSEGKAFNAHLSAHAEAGEVLAGDVIGYVGRSGNARTTSPHDHFEWHPGGDAAVDPYLYLTHVCGV